MLHICFSVCLQLILGIPELSGLFSQNSNYKLISQSLHGKLKVSVYKNLTYSKAEMEALYKVVCFNRLKKNSREFYLKKANQTLRTKLLSNFILTEDTNTGMLLYPYGWENDDIPPKEIRENCLIIIENDIQPIE